MIGLIPAAIFTADTVIKHWVDKNFPMDRKQYIFGRRILIRKYYNKGVAFNVLEDSPEVIRGIHTGIFTVLAGVYVYLLRQKGNVWLKASLGMMAGGGASNLFDRLGKGHVVDYFSFVTPWERVNKIVFNISDMFIFAGAVLVCMIQRLTKS